MSLASGARIGPYEVIAQIGVGGMGEVYRASDTKLKRQVAIKILPSALAADPDRLARFQREAEVLASLNHPNIAGIYGVEETDGSQALIMELVEGQDLAQRLARGPIPVDETLAIARQIAEALEAAHEQGIVHRDLKPANVKVREDGTVKVLDFGLAKALDPVGARSADAMNSPTLTARSTQAGMILGTAAYMAPEQARGNAVDKRADVWAFGCVLFEMLTGHRAFPGDNVSDTLAAVLRGEPDWAALPAGTPAPVWRVLRRCLVKDRKDRLGDLSAARLDLNEASGATFGEVAAASRPPRQRAHIVTLLSFTVLGAMLAAAAVWALRPASPPSANLHLTIDLPAGQRIPGSNGSGVTISRDGRVVAYETAEEGAPSRLMVRPMDRDEASAVQGSEGSYAPFFSPDGREIGFFAQGKLWRAPVSGGAPFQIAPVDPLTDRGAAWGFDGYVYIGSASGIARVPVSGGAREVLTTVDRAAGEIAHRFPEVLPGGRGVFFTMLRGGLDDSRVGVLDLNTKKARVLLDQPGYTAKYLPTGHLVFLRAGVLMAVPFDLSRLEVVGTPQPVLNDVAFNNGGAGHFAVSDTGVLVYMTGRQAGKTTPVWADRAGVVESVGAPSDTFLDAVLSPDGRRVALERRAAAGSDILIWDLARKSLTPLTRNSSALNAATVWMPDGRVIIFSSRPRGIGSPAYLFRVTVDEGRAPERISPKDVDALAGSAGQDPGSVSTDGTEVFFDQHQTREEGLYRLRIGASQAEVILPRSALSPRISPDGRWLAYVAGGEVWVRSYPDATDTQWPVSTDGGTSPRWSRDSRELFYRSGSNVMVAAADPRTGFASVRPKTLFNAQSMLAQFDVSADGQKFLMLRMDAPPELEPRVIVNWFDELKRLVPR